MAINVILADDHPVLLSGMALVCSNVHDINVVGKAKNSSEIVDLLTHHPCDILLTDYSMPGGSYGDGLGMLSFIKRSFPHVKIIVFTMIDNDSIVYEILRTGVKMVLKKSEDMHRLVEVIHLVHRGNTSLAERPSVDDDDDLSDMPMLSRREVEVIRLYVDGASVTQIAQQLHRTKQTVSTQKSSAMKKLGLNCDLDLFRFAYQKGMLQGSGMLLEHCLGNSGPPLAV